MPSINNQEFENYLGQVYPIELETKDTTERITPASYLHLLLSIGRDGVNCTPPFKTNEMISISIINFPFLSSDIPSSPAYGVFISQLIRYTWAWSSYECFILKDRRLSSKLLKLGYLVECLKLSLRGSFSAIWSPPLTNVSKMTFWPSTSYSDFPTDHPFYQFHDIDTGIDLHRITSVFHGAFATGLAY